MKEVKIIYCYDENKNAIHYSKTIKGKKYFCIDCGAELICKDGNIKIKHLAHKNTENCGGTGESIFHKHWKENLFKAGMFINIANKMSEPNNIEILDVLNEVSLNKRYLKNWDIEIIVDVLLVTEKGDVVVEINYKNHKDWDKLKQYYDELNLLRVYEVLVDKNINTKLEWFYLGEDEEIKKIEKQKQENERKQKLEEYERYKEKERLKEERKKERAKLKKEKQEEEEQKRKELLKHGVIKQYKILFNNKTNIKKIDDDNYIFSCVLEKKENEKIQYKNIRLKFVLDKINCTKDKIYNKFYSSYVIKYCYVTVNSIPTNDNCYEVIDFSNIYEEEYNKYLYAKLCNVS